MARRQFATLQHFDGFQSKTEIEWQAVAAGAVENDPRQTCRDEGCADRTFSFMDERSDLAGRDYRDHICA
jgi:hypothetical protein